jgi:DNA-directed RNA polymerase specialized sigma24 family protein
MKPRQNADADLAVRIAHKDEAAVEAFESLMRKHNGRLFRIARAILKDDAEAEDALQDAYLDAYQNIEEFRGASQLGTWLTRIVINQALGRLRKQNASVSSCRSARAVRAGRTTSRWSFETTKANRRPMRRCALRYDGYSSVELTSSLSPSAPFS